jgi:hypothetical protein
MPLQSLILQPHLSSNPLRPYSEEAVVESLVRKLVQLPEVLPDMR